jgi:hypothetical protein
MQVDTYGRLYFIDGNKLNRFHNYFDVIYSHNGTLETIKIIEDKINVGTSNSYGKILIDSINNYALTNTFTNVEAGVTHISKSSYGEFILSKNKIFHFDEDVIRKYSFPGIVDYLSDVNGSTIIHDDENGLSIFVNGKFKIINKSLFLSKEIVVDIKSINVGEYIVATEKAGLFLFDGDSFIPYAQDITENLVIQSMEVIKKTDTDYEVIIISNNNELISIDKSGFELFRKNYTEEVYDLLYSDKRMLYVATSKGIDVFFYGLPFKVVDFTSDAIHGPLAIYKDRLYWGSIDGLSFQQINELKQLSGKEIKVKDTDGKVGKLDIVQNTLIMSHEDGLYHILPKIGARFIPDEKFFNFSPIADGYLIAFGKRKNYLLKLINRKWRVQKVLENLPIHPKSVVFDKYSQLWLVDRDYNLIRYSYDEINLELEEVSREENNNKVKLFSFNNSLVLIKERQAYEFDGQEFNLSKDLSAVLGDDIDLEQVTNDKYGNVWYIQNGKVGIFRSFIEDGKKKYKKLSIDYPFMDPRSVFPYDKNNIFINNGDYYVNIDLENYLKTKMNPLLVDRVYVVKKNGQIRNKYLLENEESLGISKTKTDDELHVTFYGNLRPDSKYSIESENYADALSNASYVGSPAVFDNNSFTFDIEDFYGYSEKVDWTIKSRKPLVQSTIFWWFLGIFNLILWILAFIFGYQFKNLRERKRLK